MVEKRSIDGIWPTLTILMVLILGTMTPYITVDGDPWTMEDDRMNSPLDVTRSSDLDQVRTSFMLDVTDEGWIDDMDHIRSIEGKYLQVADKELTYLTSIPASYNSLFTDTNARSIQSYEGTIFLAYITISSGPTTIHYNLITSDDGGDTWNSPVEVHSVSGLSEGGVEIYLYQDKVFYLMLMGSVDDSLNGVEIKVVSYLAYRDLPSTVSLELGSKCPEETKIIGYKDEVLVFLKDKGYNSVRFNRYNNGSWDGATHFTWSSHMCPLVGDIGMGDMLYVFYTFPTSPLNIYEKYSRDGGRTWSSTGLAASSENFIARFSGAFSRGYFHLASTFSVSDNYDLGYIAYNGTSRELQVIDTFSSNGLDPDHHELMVSADGLDVTIGIESGIGTVTLVTSQDNGERFFRERIFGKGEGHCISMDEERGYAAFMNGTDLEVHKWTEATEGTLLTIPLSPIGVTSWDSFGFALGGVEEGSSFEFRILSGDGSEQLYPANGMHSMESLSEGSFGTYSYSHAGDFSGSFSAGMTVVESMVIEIEMTRGSTMNPTFYGMMINYTIGYPYNETFQIPGHLHLLDNCTMAEDGIQLEPARSQGKVIIGPFQKETAYPDHLYGTFSFLEGGNYAEISLLGSDLEEIVGFSTDDTDRISVSDEVVFIKWDRNNLFDLRSSCEEFYIDVTLVKVGISTPRIGWLELGASEAPTVDGITLSNATILRGESTEIFISTHDREDPLEHLSIELEIHDPATGKWSRDQVSDPYWNGENWSCDFITDHQSSYGDIRIRAWAMDGVGLLSDVIEFQTVIHVKNNIPLPPKVYLTPSRPRSGDALGVHSQMNGSDLETAQEDLRYNVYLYLNGNILDTLTNLSSPDHLFDDHQLSEGDDWSILVTTWDGQAESPPFQLGFIVDNTGPHLVFTPPPITIEEDVIRHEIEYRHWFGDIDDEELTFEFSIPDWISIEEVDGILFLTPEEDLHGLAYILITATDGTENLTINVSLSVTPVNDLPSWTNIGSVWVDEGDWVEIMISAFDIRDREDVFVETDIQMVLPGLVQGVNLVTYANGDLRLRPTNEMVGTHNVTYTITDGEHTITRYLSIEINNTNQPPSKPRLTIEPKLMTFIEGEIVELVVSSTDPDTIWGDGLTYTWSSDIQGDLGEGDTITPTLIVGAHLIEVEVTDLEGLSNTTTFALTIVEVPTSDGEVMRTSTLYALAAAFGLIGGIILALAVLALARQRKKKGEGKKIEDDEVETPSGGPEAGAGDQKVLPQSRHNDLNPAPPDVSPTATKAPPAVPSGVEDGPSAPVVPGPSGNVQEGGD